MSKISDPATRFFRQATSFLFLSHPFRTSMGVVLGLVLHGFIPVFAKPIYDLTGLDFSGVPTYAWIALGVFSLHLKSLVKPKPLPDEVNTILSVIEEARKVGISDAEIETKYKKLIELRFRKLSDNQNLIKEIDDLKRKRTSRRR